MTGRLPPANRHAAPSDVSPSTYDRAVREIVAGREQAGPLKFTKAQEHHIETRVKIEVKAAIEQLHKSFEAEVQKRNKADIDKLFPDLEEIREKARTTEKYHREQLEKNALFTEAEYITILTCLHPDNVASKEKRDTAFKTFSAIKIQLTGKR